MTSRIRGRLRMDLERRRYEGLDGMVGAAAVGDSAEEPDGWGGAEAASGSVGWADYSGGEWWDADVKGVGRLKDEE